MIVYVRNTTRVKHMVKVCGEMRIFAMDIHGDCFVNSCMSGTSALDEYSLRMRRCLYAEPMQYIYGSTGSIFGSRPFPCCSQEDRDEYAADEELCS